jgi:hypothetical protein
VSSEIGMGRLGKARIYACGSGLCITHHLAHAEIWCECPQTTQSRPIEE